MKKLIVTCTAVVYAIAFVGCGEGSGSVEDPPNNDEGPPAETGDEGGGEEGGE